MKGYSLRPDEITVDIRMRGQMVTPSIDNEN